MFPWSRSDAKSIYNGKRGIGWSPERVFFLNDSEGPLKVEQYNLSLFRVLSHSDSSVSQECEDPWLRLAKLPAIRRLNVSGRASQMHFDFIQQNFSAVLRKCFFSELTVCSDVSVRRKAGRPFFS